MGVIGSPTGRGQSQLSRNFTITRSNDIAEYTGGGETMSINIRNRSRNCSPMLINSSNTMNSRLMQTQNPSTAFYSVAARKISIPVPTERPYHTKQGTKSGVMSKLFIKYNKQISDKRSQVDRFSNKPYELTSPSNALSSTVDQIKCGRIVQQ